MHDRNAVIGLTFYVSILFRTPPNYLGELYSEWEARIADQYRAAAIAQMRSDLQRYDNCEQELAELAAAEAGQGDEDTENDIWATILEIAQANHDTF